MELTTDIKMHDHQAFTRFVWYSGARGTWLWFVLIFAGVFAISLMLEFNAGYRLDSPTMLVTMVILCGYLALAQRRIRPLADGTALGPRTFQITPEGLREKSQHYESLTRWSGVRDIGDTREHIFVMIDNCEAHIVPKRSFADDGHCRRFLDELERRMGSAAVTVPRRQADAEPSPA